MKRFYQNPQSIIKILVTTQPKGIWVWFLGKSP
jgi:hypothetical protein